MADMMSVGVTGLRAFQSALNTVSHNIANVNTEGYSRQRVTLSTAQPTIQNGFWSGSGVQQTGVERIYQSFVADAVTAGYTTTKELEVYSTYASRLDDLYSDPDVGAAPAIQDFFDSLQDLASDPNSAAARQLVLSNAETLASRYNQLSAATEEVRGQLNEALRVTTRDLQGLADSMASVNQAIIDATASNGGVTPPDLLDQRDNLVNEMAKLTSVRTVEQDDGALNVFIGNGMSLVMGAQSATLSVQASTTDVSALDITFKPIGGANSVVITDYMSGGQIGGLLRVKDEVLDPALDQLGLTAVGISEQINAQHALGYDLNGVLGGDFFTPLEGQVLGNSANSGTGVVSMAFVDSSHLTGDNYRLTYDGTNYQVFRNDETTAIYSGATFPSGEVASQGFSLTLDSGTINAGDSFLIHPTRLAAETLQVAISDTDEIAAAQAAGLSGDNRNALAMESLQNADTMLNGTATFIETYSRMVSKIGVETRQSELAFDAQTGLLQQAQAKQSEISGVNLDEEAADLLRYQQAYQAAAQVISIAQSTFDALLNAVR